MKLVLLSGAHSHTVGYLKQIKEDRTLDLVGVWDDFASRGQEIAREMGCPFVPELSDAVGIDSVDSAVICADNAGHRPLVEASLSAGLDVFCEKPMALSVADADAMVAATRAAGRFTVLGYKIPYTGPMVVLRQLVADGAIGTINQVRYRNAHHAAYGHWFDSPERQWFTDPAKAGGGAFLDMGTHAVHLLRLIFGRMVAVQAVINNRSGVYPDVDDYGIALAELADGACAVIEASWVLTAGQRGLEVLGSEGAIYVTDQVQLVRWADGKSSEPEIVTQADDEPARIDRLVALREGRIDRATADADLDIYRDTVAVMCAAYESVRTGTRQVID